MVLMFVFSMIDFFFYHPLTRAIATELQTWALILAGFTLGLGAINIFVIHGTRVIKRERGKWMPSGLLVTVLLVMFISGISDLNLANPVFEFMYEHVYLALYSATYAFTGFYIVAAVFRAYRVRTFEASILLISGVLVILKNAPIGEAIIGTSLVPITDWMLAVPNTGGSMGLAITGAIGVIILSLRTLLGLERGFLGGAE